MKLTDPLTSYEKNELINAVENYLAIYSSNPSAQDQDRRVAWTAVVNLVTKFVERRSKCR